MYFQIELSGVWYGLPLRRWATCEVAIGHALAFLPPDLSPEAILAFFSNHILQDKMI